MLAIFTLFNSLFNAFVLFLISIPVVLVVLGLVIWQTVQQKKRNDENAQQTKEYEKSIAYCRNCGFRMGAPANICQKCGVEKGIGKNFCYRCGNRADQQAIICVNCGVSLERRKTDNISDKSKIAAGFLGLLFGSLGIHNFYLGYTLKAVAQLLLTVFSILTGILMGFAITSIWGFIEGAMIFAGGIPKDAKGALLK